MDYILEKHKRKISFLKKKEKRKNDKDENFTQSIHSLHKEKLDYFNKIYSKEILAKKKKELLKEKNKKMIPALQQEIFEIENRTEESFYFLKNYKILEEYENELKIGDSLKIKNLTKNFCDLNEIPYKDSESKQELIEYNNTCPNCNSNDLGDTDESCICYDCGFVLTSIITQEPTFNNTSNYSSIIVSKIQYKRENYFDELLKKIQGKKTSDLPTELIDNVKNELFILNIVESKDVKYEIIKKILKKLNYSKYYNYIPTIINIIIKQPSLNIPAPVEKILKHMFSVIQEPWSILKDPGRSSFTHYPYVLYKFFQILELDEYLKYISLIKDDKKLNNIEILWEKIMDYIVTNDLDRDYYYDINWRFIPL